MRLTKEQGGHSIAVYNSQKPGSKEHAKQLVSEGRATLHTPADYRKGKGLDLAIKAILDKIEATYRIGL